MAKWPTVRICVVAVRVPPQVNYPQHTCPMSGIYLQLYLYLWPGKVILHGGAITITCNDGSRLTLLDPTPRPGPVGLKPVEGGLYFHAGFT